MASAAQRRKKRIERKVKAQRLSRDAQVQAGTSESVTASQTPEAISVKASRTEALNPISPTHQLADVLHLLAEVRQGVFDLCVVRELRRHVPDAVLHDHLQVVVGGDRHREGQVRRRNAADVRAERAVGPVAARARARVDRLSRDRVAARRGGAGVLARVTRLFRCARKQQRQDHSSSAVAAP